MLALPTNGAMSHRRRTNKVKKLVPPGRAADSKTFPCSFPSAVPALRRIQDPLPFQATLVENLAWASAFIDHSGHVFKEFEASYETLEERLQVALTTIGRNDIDMEIMREKITTWTHKVQHLECDLSRTKAVNRELEQQLTSTRETATKREQDLLSRLHKSEQKLHKAQRAESRLKQKLTDELAKEHEMWAREVEHEHEDHVALDNAQKALEEAAQEKSALQQALDSANTELASTKSALEATSGRLTQCGENSQRKDAEIASLTQSLESADRDKARLNTDLENLQATCDAQGQELAAARQQLADSASQLEEARQTITTHETTITTLQTQVENLTSEVTTVRNDRDDRIRTLEEVRTSTQETITTLQTKITEMTAHDAEDEQKLAAAEQARQIAENAARDLQTQVEQARQQDEEDRRRLAAEEQARKDAEDALTRTKAELEEARKPPLPNKVSLSHPIPIAGSLGGAPDNIDDTYWPLELPFAVTIFGHASTKVFVTSNGLLSLDAGTSAYTHRQLPFRSSDLPAYTLLPFWADLYIYKDTPQGIYYEIAGDAPARTLTVEWYVSRYQNKEQYYHFSLTLYENQPNVVTYKFFEALDQGGACTIGAQGPDSYQLWSFNQPKALPGVKIDIDTASGSVQESTFQVPS
jgi:predicted  nucleic acid-binding Zn-ribbon protein